MSTLQFADTYNLVAFLSKPAECEGFEQIVDFLNAHTIKYALTVNPTICTSCIEQFWSTIKAKTINGKIQLRALVDRKKVIITESTIRKDLQLEYAEEEEEVRLAREKVEKEQEANVALIKEWNDIQEKIVADQRKHFTAKRAEGKKNRPPTKAQQRSIMVNTFVDFKIELVEGTKKREGLEKRAGIKLEQEVVKKQKVDVDKETEQETAEL
ncbi:hypothetical protein Tco_0769705 [Tanacetum coccineum]|uniref:Xylulose kinase-1 n=1 Tax=Tanacetum coccineum TaxID=301880 RepID=A0ABQ4ZA52_9ASTR